MVAAGVPCMFWIYAHATMVDPSLPDSVWRWNVAQKYFLSNGGIGTIMAAFTLTGVISVVLVAMRLRISGGWILWMLTMLAILMIGMLFA